MPFVGFTGRRLLTSPLYSIDFVESPISLKGNLLKIVIFAFFLRLSDDVLIFTIFAPIKPNRMKKCLLIIAALLILVLPSCKKTRYCKCTTIQNDEVVELGSDYYTIEDGSSCNDKSKEIVGWGQVVCTEVSESDVTGQEHHWWDDIFGGGNHNNNNGGNNGGNGGH